MTKNEPTPRGLQKTFLSTLFAAYAVQAALSCMSLFQFHLEGVNAVAFYLNIAQLVLVPLVLFFAAWAISPRKISKLGKAFESGVLAIVGFAAITVFGTLVIFLPGGAWYRYPLSSMAVPIVVTVVYVVVLLVLRSTKRWQ
jgi:hypothetical protein